jgi:hemoglobin
MQGITRMLTVCLVAVPLFAGAAQAQDSLYKRLGGYDGIAAFVDELIAQVREEKFRGFSTSSQQRVRQNIVDFMCKATGGPCNYSGRDIKTAHAGIGITTKDWQKFLTVFNNTMRKFKLPERTQKDLAALLLPLEKDIVEKR